MSSSGALGDLTQVKNPLSARSTAERSVRPYGPSSGRADGRWKITNLDTLNAAG